MPAAGRPRTPTGHGTHVAAVAAVAAAAAGSAKESWQTDPLCLAVRNASAAGITVVVAAGNFGQSSNGQEVNGAISAPGNDPTVITVGAVNFKGTVGRGDDVVNNFSARGPTRGAMLNAQGQRTVDNLLKPDLLAPGNKIVSAAATRASISNPTWNYLASTYAASLVTPLGITPIYPETQMLLSGTSVAAPVVAGTVALMLQANPGLSPPLIKAMLQYSAQPLAGANLLQQGAGYLNVSGALALATALRSDIGPAADAGTLAAGANLLAAGKALPAAKSSLNGQSFNWSRVVTAGGNRLLSGDALFPQYQPIWDPRLVWAGSTARHGAIA